MSAAQQLTPASREHRAVLLRARRVRADLRFLRLYARVVPRVMRYHPHADEILHSTTAEDIVGRIEDELAGEAAVYRALGWCILVLLVAIPGLAIFLFQAMYWLPFTIYWFPFERGLYGLPYFSLFEWLAFLVLTLYFVVTGGLLVWSHDETARLGTQLRRLSDAGPETREAIIAIVAAGGYPRLEYLLRNRPEFSVYQTLLAEKNAA
jgi:hypothetical protein